MIRQGGFARVDFSGPGGTSTGLRMVGIKSVGVEFEKDAVATARAAGHQVWYADVRTVRDYAWSPLWLYCASPPCQSYSMAGKGKGREQLEQIKAAAHDVARGVLPEVAAAGLDERAVLSLEPLYVVATRRPRNVILEQVPTVQPLWDVYAEIMREMGYSVATKVLHAEQYGVPQTRRRAILAASLDREARLPGPTHSRYYPHNRAKLDDGVKPWVSMAQALGWGLDARPALTLSPGTAAGGPDPLGTGGSGARATIAREIEEGRWIDAQKRNAGPAADRDPRPLSDPSYTIRAQGSGSHPSGSEWVLRNNTSDHAAVRPVDTPAPTMYFGKRVNMMTFESADRLPNGGDASWVEQRPAPTMVGSFHPDIVAAPKYRKAGDGPRQKSPGSVQITAEEAATLQTFPPGYPFVGTKSSVFMQIGNAWPPLMAAHVAWALLSDPDATVDAVAKVD